jgi:hypothetical protein
VPRAPGIAHSPLRSLRVYAFDPSRGARLDNHLTIQIPNERLKKGPSGKKIVVVDYDISNQCYYEGVDLDSASVLGQNGLAPSESDPRFHQQMVYAVTMETIQRFEYALGREIKWKLPSDPQSFPNQLKIFPHAMQEANAFYDTRLHAILFGYFTATENDAGVNLPGQIVFTCLSHDIIAHEVTHAVLDDIRDYFSDPSGVDAPAFHEGFADIIALLQHFSFKQTLVNTIQRTGGLIHRKQLVPDVTAIGTEPLIQVEVGEDNPMVDLARQFGEAMGNRKALRSALGTTPNPAALQLSVEPHERGAIFVAAIFDAFFSVYINRTRDLIRMAYPQGREVVPNFLSADLTDRLADEAAKTARRIQNICMRALDYCPPVDITFGDYLRALVTADREVRTDDENGYRTALINAFRARGIRPAGVLSYSEDSLSWPRYEGPSRKRFKPDFDRLWKALNKYEDQPERKNEKRLYHRLWGDAIAFRMQLGLSRRRKIEPKSLNLLHRVQPDGSLQRQIVAELVQTEKLRVDPNDKSSGTFTFRGGTTVLINRQGDVTYAISKPIDGDDAEARKERQRAYIRSLRTASGLAPYVGFDPDRDQKFQYVHRGY